MLNILEMTLSELTQWVTGDLGLPKFRAQQIWQWVWQRMARSFDEMTNISKPVREELSKKAQIVWPEVDKILTSSDSTTKFLLRLGDGERVETVLIPSTSREGNVRWTQCLSTQVGCPMHCTFCSTGTMGFTRNMTMGEILGQILVARDYLGDTRPQWPVLRNLVFMGMGEPLLNFENLERALKSLNEDGGLNFSPRRITVSTCGIEKDSGSSAKAGSRFLLFHCTLPHRNCARKSCPERQNGRWKNF